MTTPPRAALLPLLTAMAGLSLGIAGLWLGVTEGAIALWGFGVASLLQVPPALSLRGRIQDGLGNSGLERERRTLRTVGFLQRFLALGLAMAAISALLGERMPQGGLSALGVECLAVGCIGLIWYVKQGLKGIHPTLDLDAARTRSLLDLSVLLLLGTLLGRWFPWADAVFALALALRLFFEGRTLAKATTLPVACGGCGSGCG